MKLYRKTYGVFGLVEYNTLIPLGKGRMRIEFTNGSITVRGIEPASFTTDNPVVQAAIEESDKFKKGRIKLVSKYIIGETTNEKVDESCEADVLPNEDSLQKDVYPDVKNSQQAKDVLMNAPYNVSLAELGNKTSIKQCAEELGISFPNWN